MLDTLSHHSPLPDPSPYAPPEEHPEHPYRFTPVPRRSTRVDGWSSDRQHAFVWALAHLPSVAAAARSVGMSARSAYRLRGAPGAEAFAQAWDDALEIGVWKARDTAVERAIEGVVIPVVRRGRVIGQERRYNDRLLISALVNGASEQTGLLPHQQRIEYRRAVREADARDGAPVDWDAPARARAAEAEAQARVGQASADADHAAALAAGPLRRAGGAPRCSRP